MHSQHKALVDSGAAGNFIDRSIAHSLGTPIVPVAVPFPIHVLDGQPLGSGLISEATAPLGMVMQGGHKERISLFLINSPAFPVVLGLPWLVCHDHTVAWPQRALTGWSRECSGRCLMVSVGATTVESPDQVSTVRIPPEYADLALTFSKKEGDSITTPSTGRLRDKSPGRHRTSQESRVFPLTGGEGGYGNICLRIPRSGVNSVIHFTCHLRFFRGEEEGGRSVPVY
jgi:hypothetical protein